MNDPVLGLIGRIDPLFLHDIEKNKAEINRLVSSSRFLVLGAAGSIGTAVTHEIAKRRPQKLHLLDISENNLVELVRDLRSSMETLPYDFKALALDIGSAEYDAFIESDGSYDYVLNLSALKHVRSEKDPFTLMRMINVNILNTEKTIQQSIDHGVKKYFCVSTDKAANPVNLMGASKRIMEMFLVQKSKNITISTARFANVAFSDGSLLYGFDQRFAKKQPLVAPNDVKRYFVTKNESGLLCLISCLLGKNREILFPNPDKDLRLISFSDIAEKYLNQKGYKAKIYDNEEQAKLAMKSISGKTWPCLFSKSDTTGEKPFEEFYTKYEDVILDRFQEVGVVNMEIEIDENSMKKFKSEIQKLISNKYWKKEDLVDLIYLLIPSFNYSDVGKYLDSKM